MLYAACFLRLLLAPYPAFLTRNRCLGETMLFCARRAPGLRPRRPRPACGRAGVPPSPRLSPAAFCLLSRHIAPPLFSPRPAPWLRLRALCRPCGRPKPPFPGALAAAAIARSFFASYPARRAAAAVSCLLRRFYGYRHRSHFAAVFCKMLAAYIFFITISHNFHNNML